MVIAQFVYIQYIYISLTMEEDIVGKPEEKGVGNKFVKEKCK